MDNNSPAFDRLWYMRRSLLFWGQRAYFIVLAFWIGPHFFLWFWDVKPAPTNPAYFAPEVIKYCVPIVRKMKEYERANGHLPQDFKELGIADPSVNALKISLNQGEFLDYTEYHHMISYDFTPGRERWTVKGPFVNGVIPVSPVELEPVTQPSHQP